MRRKSIVYNVIRTPSGWKVQAKMPRNVSAQDRMSVLDWFGEYRSTVRRENPMWLTVFNETEHASVLDIIPTGSPTELISKATEAANNWQQLEFDYVR